MNSDDGMTVEPRDVQRLCEGMMVLAVAAQDALGEPKWWWPKRWRDQHEFRRVEISKAWGLAAEVHNSCYRVMGKWPAHVE